MQETGDKYTDDVLGIIDGHRYEFDDECDLGGLADHVISPDPLGNPHAWCKPRERTDNSARDDLDYERYGRIAEWNRQFITDGYYRPAREVTGNPTDDKYIADAEAAVMHMWLHGCRTCRQNSMAGHVLQPGPGGNPVIICQV